MSTDAVEELARQFITLCDTTDDEPFMRAIVQRLITAARAEGATPHAPEGGDVAAAQQALESRIAEMLAEHANPWEAADQIAALIAATRAEAATAERARLAGMASEEDREMVSNLIAESIRCGMWNAREAPLHAKDCSDKADGVAESLLARLAAARGEALEEAAKVCENWFATDLWPAHSITVEERNAAEAASEDLATRIRALLPRDGTGVG